MAAQRLLHRSHAGRCCGQCVDPRSRVFCHDGLRQSGAQPGLHLAVDPGSGHHAGHRAGVRHPLAQSTLGRSGRAQGRPEPERHTAARNHGHPARAPAPVDWHLCQLHARLRIAARLHVLGLHGDARGHALYFAVPGPDRPDRWALGLDRGAGRALAGAGGRVGTAAPDAGHAREHERKRRQAKRAGRVFAQSGTAQGPQRRKLPATALGKSQPGHHRFIQKNPRPEQPDAGPDGQHAAAGDRGHGGLWRLHDR